MSRDSESGSPDESRDISRLLRLRQQMNRRRPRFLHQEHWKLKKFKKASWRRPRGKRSKMRTKEKAKPFLVSIGYRGPKKVRGLHPRGVPEILVHSVQDIERIHKERTGELGKEEKERKTAKSEKKKGKGKRKRKKEKPYEYVIRIASSVGTRKRIEIVKAAVEKHVYVANPSIGFVKVTSMEELESFIPIRKYIAEWFISDKVPEDDRDDIEARAEEIGIEVVE